MNWSRVLAVAWALSASAVQSIAQEFDGLPDSVLTGAEWQQRVQEARRRSEEFVANARTQTANPLPSEKEDAEAADRRAMNDPSLQPGDIVSTSQGFVVFVGREGEEHHPGDFRPAPHPQSPR